MYHVLHNVNFLDLSDLVELPEVQQYRKNGHTICKVVIDPDEKANTSDQLLFKFVGDLFELYGYKSHKVNRENVDDVCNIEYHIYSSDGRVVSSSFGVHQDNGGAVPYRVNTCIIYLENTFEKGGELFITTQDTTADDDKIDPAIIKEVIPIRPGMTVLMAGDVWHGIRSCRGIGRRRCVVVQVKILAE